MTRARFGLSVAGVAAALLAAACASKPAAPAADAAATQTAVIIVYRPHTDANPDGYPFVYLDGARKGALNTGGILVNAVDPGAHRLMLTNPALWEGQQYWPINAVAGRRYFYRVRAGDYPDEETVSARYLSRQARVDEVPEDLANTEIRGLQDAEKDAAAKR